MKSIILASLMTLTASFAFAEDVQEITDPSHQIPEIIYMSLGSAPYRGYAEGRLTLSNKGPNPLTNIRYKIRGMGFTAKDNCPKVVAVNESCRIKVTYWNQFPGGASGELSVTTSDKSYEVQLSAYGQNDPWGNVPPRPGNPFPRP